MRGVPRAMVKATTPGDATLRLRLGFSQGVTIVGGFGNPVDLTLLDSADLARLQTAFQSWRIVAANVSLRSQVSLATGTPQLSPPAAFAIKWFGAGATPPVPASFAKIFEIGGAKVVNASSQSSDRATVVYRTNRTLMNDLLWNDTTSATSIYGSPWIVAYLPSAVAGADWLLYGWIEVEFRSLVIA